MDKTEAEWQYQPHRVRIAAGGRIVIPAEVRQELGEKEGDELLLTRDKGGIRISTVEQTVREVQAYFRQFKRPGRSVVDELLKERADEAAAEGRGERTKRSNKSDTHG